MAANAPLSVHNADLQDFPFIAHGLHYKNVTRNSLNLSLKYFLQL
jgi:hypothetical protein